MSFGTEYFNQIETIVEAARAAYPHFRYRMQRPEKITFVDLHGAGDLVLNMWMSGPTIEVNTTTRTDAKSQTVIKIKKDNTWHDELRAAVARLVEADRLTRIADYWALSPEQRCRDTDGAAMRVAMLQQMLTVASPSDLRIRIVDNRLVFSLNIITSATIDGDDVVLTGPVVTARYRVDTQAGWAQLTRDWRNWLHQETM